MISDRERERLEKLGRRWRNLEALAKNEDFKAIFLPHFQQRAEYHAKQCRNRDLTPEKRAEHIEAADLAEKLLTYVEDQLETAKKEIEKAQK